MISSVRRIEAGPAGGFDIHTRRATAEGPRCVVLGGVHGDETEGALAAGRLAVAEVPLVYGRLDVVPVCHEAAFFADSRTSPIDGGNLARVFPGDPSGTATPQLAHHLYKEVLEGADFLIDLHTSGQNYDMPFLAGYRGEESGSDSISEKAAIVFGADFVWRHPERSEGRTISVVEHAIYIESAGSGPTSPSTVTHYYEGVLRVLSLLGMIEDAPLGPDRSQIRVVGGGNLDRDMRSVGSHGVFITEVRHGDYIESGQVLGRVVDRYGRVIEEHRTDSPGWVIALKHRSPVHAGDMVVCIAAPEV